MYTEAISDPIWELLRRLNPIPDMTYSYLGGGTALALQIGHRRSEDLDFFVTEEFNDLSFKQNIQLERLDTLVVNQTPNHTEMMIQSIKVDFVRERIPLKFPLKAIHPQTQKLNMADSRDIGRMKIISIGSRGSKKDFVDLYCLTRKIMTLESLIMMAMEEDRGLKYSKLLFLKGLVDFEEAEREGDLAMIWDIGWEEVKDSLMEDVKRIATKI
jgi:hypothetical protein